MSYDDHIFVVEDGGADGVVPEGKHSVDCYLEGFSAGESICWQVIVLWGKPWVPLVIDVQRWWWDIVASSPLQHLLLTMLSRCLRLIESLKCSIMPLIESPVFVMWNPPNI